MSTYWGYYSKTTKEQSPCWYNKGDKILKEIYINKELIRKIINYSFNSELNIVIDFNGYAWEPIEWLEEREGQDICLINEYGKTKEIIKTD